MAFSTDYAGGGGAFGKLKSRLLEEDEDTESDIVLERETTFGNLEITPGNGQGMSQTSLLPLAKRDGITNGQTLQNSTVDDLMWNTQFRVVGVIDVGNFTLFNLTDPRMRTDGGKSSVHPRDVKHFTREAIVVHKYPFTSTGSYGTLSFYIRELDCRVVLMWSLPFNHDFYSNWLALDITQGRTIDHSKLFDKMYNEEGVCRTEYDREFRETWLKRDGISLTASMTSSHHSHIQLKVERTEERVV